MARTTLAPTNGQATRSDRCVKDYPTDHNTCEWCGRRVGWNCFRTGDGTPLCGRCAAIRNGTGTKKDEGRSVFAELDAQKKRISDLERRVEELANSQATRETRDGSDHSEV